MTGPAQASTRPPATHDAPQVRPVRCRQPPLRSRQGRPSSCWCNEPRPNGVTATLGKGLAGARCSLGGPHDNPRRDVFAGHGIHGGVTLAVLVTACGQPVTTETVATPSAANGRPQGGPVPAELLGEQPDEYRLTRYDRKR